jgi:putative tricarboxylic transport membrane protein
MLISGGSLDVFVTRPISGGLFAVMALIVVVSIVTSRRRSRVLHRHDAPATSTDNDLAPARRDGEGAS